MKTATEIILSAFLTLIAVQSARAAEGKLAVVAAENFYGDIARQIGGDRVDVTSIMSNPDQDPHLFETSPGIGAIRSRTPRSSSITAPTTMHGWKSC